jgi:hypothetical protein
MGKQNATDDDDDDDMRGKGNGDDDNDDDDDDDWCKNKKWVFLPPSGEYVYSYENRQGPNRSLPYIIIRFLIYC